MRNGGKILVSLFEALSTLTPGPYTYTLPGAWNAEGFVAAVEAFMAEEGRGPTCLVLDNASISPRRLRPRAASGMGRKGADPVLLPAYSPELNKIEIRWHRCKHYWLTPADYACDRTLQERIAFVLKNVGTRYTVTFG